MTEIFSSVRCSAIAAVATIAIVSSASPSPAVAQTSGPSATLAAEQPTQVRLTMGDAARLAAHQSAIAQGARLRADEAQSRVRQRKADLLPTVSSYIQEAGRTFNTSTLGIEFPTPPGQPPVFDPKGQVEGPVNTLDVRGRVQQNLLDFAALGRVRSAQAQARSSNADADATAEQAATIATTAYVRAMRADADLRARQADTLLATELLRIAQSQLQAGTGVGLDVTRARAQLAATRASLIASRNARDHAHLDLLRSLALPVGTDIVLVDSLSLAAAGESFPDEAALVAQAVRSRPDLLAEEERIRAAKQGLSAIKAERLPSLGLVADDGVIGKNGAKMLNTYTWGLQVTLPIFDGFKREARLQEQQSVVKEAEIRRRDLEQQAQVDVRGALIDLAGAREQLDAATERLALAEQELAQARDRFNAGVAGNADVVNASLALTASRTLVNDAETAYQLARVALARATGSVTTLR
ncbi:MAG TPA: TolC family protein [Gemmatimonadaceae bacterium]|nr:TolC family protein [Gemmatimonadaceae bacterium]